MDAGRACGLFLDGGGLGNPHGQVKRYPLEYILQHAMGI